jgi:hypothetical protein
MHPGTPSRVEQWLELLEPPDMSPFQGDDITVVLNHRKGGRILVVRSRFTQKINFEALMNRFFRAETQVEVAYGVPVLEPKRISKGCYGFCSILCDGALNINCI